MMQNVDGSIVREQYRVLVDDVRDDLVATLQPRKPRLRQPRLGKRIASLHQEPVRMYAEYIFAQRAVEGVESAAEENHWTPEEILHYKVVQAATTVADIILSNLVQRDSMHNLRYWQKVFVDADDRPVSASDIETQWSQSYADRMIDAIHIGNTSE